jgi:enamine deaminase RidA (YjgF/YER057c/UK114 family)
MPETDKRVIVPDEGTPPLDPYSPGVQWNQFVFASGQIDMDPDTGKLGGRCVEAETRKSKKIIRNSVCYGFFLVVNLESNYK